MAVSALILGRVGFECFQIFLYAPGSCSDITYSLPLPQTNFPMVSKFVWFSGSTIVGVGSPDPPLFVYDEEEYKDVFLSGKLLKYCQLICLFPFSIWLQAYHSNTPGWNGHKDLDRLKAELNEANSVTGLQCGKIFDKNNLVIHFRKKYFALVILIFCGQPCGLSFLIYVWLVLIPYIRRSDNCEKDECNLSSFFLGRKIYSDHDIWMKYLSRAEANFITRESNQWYGERASSTAASACGSGPGFSSLPWWNPSKSF